MSFPAQPVRPLTRAAVEALPPGEVGCYGLYRAGTWVYVGRGDVRARLLDHLDGDDPRITRQAPTHFVVLMTADCDAEARRLIAELSPIANKQL